jgi:CRISPR-associated protein Cst1
MSGALHLTGHPMQRCGAWAVAALADLARRDLSGQAEQEAVHAGRSRASSGTTPEDVTAHELDGVVLRIAGDVAEAAVAQPGSAAYDWWKVLFALYPNSPPTHARRERDRKAMRQETGRLLGPDMADAVMRPCTFCGVPCSTLWAKSLLPMFDTTRALNTLPPGSAGWPVCRACRVSLWALPYGAWLTAGSATVLTCTDPEVERRFVLGNVKRALRIQQTGFISLPAGAGPEAVTLAALEEHSTATFSTHTAIAPERASGGSAKGTAPAATLWMFKNDNQEPWLRVSGTRVGVVKFLHLVRADSDAREGWRRLQRALERRDGSNAIILDGATARARLLFDSEDEVGDRLLRELDRRLRKLDRRLCRLEEISDAVLRQWCVLAHLYLEVMHEMDTSKLTPVADLFVKWISLDASRGRFNEFHRASGSAWELHRLYRNVCGRLALDRTIPETAKDLTVDLVCPLFEQRGWRIRVALYTAVLTGLLRAGVQLGKASPDDEDDDIEDALDPKPELEEEYA